MRFEIRAARPDDAAQLVALLNDTYESTWRPHLTPAAIERVAREDRFAIYVGTWLPAFRVAAADRRVVGMIHWHDDFVAALHVRGEVRRNGIGSALLGLAERTMAAAGHGVARLETDSVNARSLAFYAGHGYREIDRYPDTEWHSGLTTVLLAKRLAFPTVPPPSGTSGA